MKKRHFLLAALSLLFLACPAGGQESPRTRIGIGIGLSDVRELLRLSSVEGGEMPSILIPIEFPSGLRIEPEVGFLSGSWNADSENEQLESNTGSFLVGFGVFTLRRSREGVLYLGARLGGLVGSSEDSYSMGGTTRTKTSWSGFFVAPAFGGEFLLSERFGLGAEVQLSYTAHRPVLLRPLNGRRP
jgi:hypothetical protein